MKKSKLMTALFAAVLFSASAFAAKPDKDIVILYTNDVHCGIDDNIGYAGLSLYKQEMLETTPYVTLVDAGDAIQGATIGMLSKGGYIITLMNQVGYDIAIPGNHEFDYGVEHFIELSKKLNCGYLSCNFTGKNGKFLLPAWKIITYGNTKVAYIGVTTPESLISSNPMNFLDKKGKQIYDFGGERLYELTQKAIDDVKKQGADYVILVAHLGEKCNMEEFSSINLIANTSGADALIDGHSHQVTPNLLVKNKDGKEIPVTQSGTKLKYIGKVVLSKDGNIYTDLTAEVPPKNGSSKDEKIEASINQIKAELSSTLDKKYGHCDFDMDALDENNKWYIRNSERNIANFITDAFKNAMKTDIAIINGGGIRANFKAGDITFNDILTVQPFNNKLYVYQIPGQTLLDELEFGVRKLPGMSGGIMHTAGLTYKVNSSIPSSVQTDEKGFFTGEVNGEYRVHDVLVNGEPLDVKKNYTVASISFFISDHGDGHLFKNVKTLSSQKPITDYEAVCNYLDILKGKVPETYRKPEGQGRLIIE